MDAADKAQIAEEREYERLWQSRHQPLAIDDEGWPYDCLDCGERIPQERVNLGFKLRCVDCQIDHEKRLSKR